MERPPTLTCAAVRELDRAAIEDWGVPSILLMENAGRACADHCLKILRERAGAASAVDGTVLVLAGPGNNGGDGFVIARTLFNRGIPVRLFFVGAADKLASLSLDTQTNARLWRELDPGTQIETVESAGAAGDITNGLGVLKTALAGQPSLIVDAMFGTGLVRELRAPWSAVVELANEAGARGAPILAVDIPSGLQGDTGQRLGAAIRATHTVTFVAAKRGLLQGEGPAHVGELVIAEIGIPRRLVRQALLEGAQRLA